MASEKSKGKNVGLVLLAAGASVRLGRPKQLLTYNGQTLLNHSIHNALDSGAQPVVVVLGAHAQQLQEKIKKDAVHLMVNANWQEGMASSIRCGVNYLLETAPSVEGLILMVCDQPYVTTSLLNELMEAHEKSGKQIIACSYENSFGPPAFFHQSLFDELLQLKGDIGARSVVRQHTDMVDVIPFPGGDVDVDTEADYERIKSKGNLD